MKYLVCFIFILNFYSVQAQQKEDFISPLKGKLQMVGAFGELRGNHFHSGLDLSTNKKTGLPVYAMSDGEINRIKVSPYGFGHALYLKHPNGYTTVYAHLERYAEPIASYIKKKQYKKESFAVEAFPLLGEFPVKKGQIIGYSGNTGGSHAPHLHLEVRDTKSEAILNPLQFKFAKKIKDTRQPVVNALWVYPKDDSVIVNRVTHPIPLSFKRVSKYKLIVDEVKTNGAIGFGVSSHDLVDDYWGKNGLYNIKLFVNDELQTEIQFDRFKFSETHFIKHFIDYKRKKLNKEYIQKMFNKNAQPIPFIKTQKNEGYVSVKKDKSYKVMIELCDYHGNKQEIIIPVIYDEATSLNTRLEKNGKYIDYYRDYIFEDNQKSLAFKADTFYEDQYLDIQLKKNSVVFGVETIPIHKKVDIRFDVSSLKINKEKTFIGRKKHNNKIEYYSTWKKGDDFRIRTKDLGTYVLTQDIHPPKIKNLSKKTNNLKDVLTFEITDDLSGISSYNGRINGHWVCFSYDYKKNKITHKISDGIARIGENKLLLEITDKIGNNRTFEFNFILK